MILRRLPVLPIAIALVWVACAAPQADDASLRASFAERIAGTEGVTDLSVEGDVIRFNGPDGEGGVAAWTVTIDTSLVEPNEFDDDMPFQGRITSVWTADGEVVEYLGNMTALPKEYLDRGLGQECWAYWMADDKRWDW